MNLVLTVLKAVGGPGSLGLFLVGLVGLTLAFRWWPRRRRAVRWCAAAFLAMHVGLALPLVSTAIINALPLQPDPDPVDIQRVRTLVVFDGDNLAGRERRTRHVLQQASPDAIWLLGPDYLLGDLLMASKRATAVHHDTTTPNTAAQVARVREIAAGDPPFSAAVVASRVQMPRIAALFAVTPSAVLLVPAPLDHEPATVGLARLVPSLGALAASRDAIYEHAALAWYRWQGDLP